MITIIDPRPVRQHQQSGSGPDAGALSGKRIGIRLDEFWQSWNWVADEWQSELKGCGAKSVTWRAPVLKGESAAAGTEEYKKFLDSVDVAIVGLCNCGSCTLWAVHDALGALDRGCPTVLVATDHFARLARTLAASSGRGDVRIVVLPYPLEGLPEDEVRSIARAHLDDLFATMGVVR